MNGIVGIHKTGRQLVTFLSKFSLPFGLGRAQTHDRGPVKVGDLEDKPGYQ
jgi:hypothetical protein